MRLTDLARERWLDLGAIASLYAVLVWAPLAAGAYRGWPLAIAQILTVSALACWVLGMTGERRLEWRRTALDLPLGLLVALVLVQLALGHGPLVTWAVGPAASDLEAPAMLPPLVLVGTVSPAQTARSFRLFLTYAAVYVLVVNLVRTRIALDRLLRMLLLLGGVVSFLALLDYLAGRAWLLGWGEPAARTRLSGAFVNPDHFAAWLEMLICLGIGYVLARSRPPEEARGAGAAWSSRRAREQMVRRFMPMIAIGVMALALVFTLSRGGIVSIAVALAALLALQGFAGRVRSSLVLVGLLLALTAGYGAWIGLEPLLDRFRSDLYTSRLLQLRSSLGMLGSFPVFGVGLGAYRDIYFRYQPPELSPGKMYFPFAHNDLLQLVVELGLVGTALCLFAAWRVAADLVGAHLLGRGRCPVGGGERDGARRGEAWSVGVGLGAVTAVLALCVHSAFDFGARIPANGFLAAACLGIATVALHTRFAGAGGRLLTAVRVLPLGGGRLRPAIARAVCLVLALACLPAIVRAPLVESSLEATGVPASVRVERALALAPADAEARWARARLRVASARRIWDSGQTEDGRVLSTWAERRREALPLFDGAVARPHRRPPRPALRPLPSRRARLGACRCRRDRRGAARGAPGGGGHRAAPGDRAATGQSVSLPLARRARPGPARAAPADCARRGPERDRARPVAAARSGRPLHAARARRRAVGAGGAGHGGRSARARRAARRGRPRRRGGGAVPPRRRAGLAGHRGAGAACPRSLAGAAGRFRGRPRRARHRAPGRPCQSGASPGARGTSSPPAGTRRRSTRSARRSGAPRRAPPRPRSMRRPSARQARGRGHSRSARSAGVSAASFDTAARSASC